MLIVSKFRDYYDAGASYGVDKEYIYRREEEVIKLDRPLTSWKLPDNAWEKLIAPEGQVTTKLYTYTSTPYVIGYCGKLYPCIKVQVGSKPFTKVFYKGEHYIDFLRENNLLKGKTRRTWLGRGDIFNEKWIEIFFNADNYREFERFFMEFKKPIFVVECKNWYNHSVRTNPQLKEFKFAKVKDVFTAFQDIYMYLSGVIGNTEKDTVDISDEDMLYKKGFDDKSFKTPKGAPERKRKKKKKTVL